MPEALSEDPFDPNFVFERHAWEPPAHCRTATEIAEENDLIEALEDRLADELQDLLDGQRREIRKQRAIQSGREWDPRPDLAVFQIDDQIWRWKDSRPPLGPDDRVEDDPSCHGSGTPYIVHEDDRELISSVTGYEMTAWPWRCIGISLNILGSLVYGALRCTGFKLYDRVVVTCGHCVPAVVQWAGGTDGIVQGVGNVYPNGVASNLLSTAHPKYADYQWRGWDIGVQILPNNCWSRNLGHLGVSSNLGLYNKPAYSYGYPGGLCEAAAAYDGNPACRASMYGMKGKITAVYAQEVNTNIDASGGQSGSPLWRYVEDGEIKVVGVIKGGSPNKRSNRAVRIEKYKHAWLQSFRDQFKTNPHGFCPPDEEVAVP